MCSTQAVQEKKTRKQRQGEELSGRHGVLGAAATPVQEGRAGTPNPSLLPLPGFEKTHRAAVRPPGRKGFQRRQGESIVSPGVVGWGVWLAASGCRAVLPPSPALASVSSASELSSHSLLIHYHQGLLPAPPPGTCA